MALYNAYDKVARQELWFCMRKSGIAEKYIRLVQDVYESSMKVVRCTIGMKDGSKVVVGLHQESAWSHFLFAIVMDRMIYIVRQDALWTKMFADDIVICSESREQMGETRERWKYCWREESVISRKKICANEMEVSGTVRLKGLELDNVHEFKHLG